MSRILIQIILPLLTPIVIYTVWSGIDRRRRGLTGLPGWEEGRWFWAVISGFGLVVVVFLGMMQIDGSRDGVYVPAHLESGKIVPGRVKPGSPSTQ